MADPDRRDARSPDAAVVAGRQALAPLDPGPRGRPSRRHRAVPWPNMQYGPGPNRSTPLARAEGQRGATPSARCGAEARARRGSSRTCRRGRQDALGVRSRPSRLSGSASVTRSAATSRETVEVSRDIVRIEARGRQLRACRGSGSRRSGSSAGLQQLLAAAIDADHAKEVTLLASASTGSRQVGHQRTLRVALSGAASAHGQGNWNCSTSRSTVGTPSTSVRGNR